MPLTSKDLDNLLGRVKTKATGVDLRQSRDNELGWISLEIDPCPAPRQTRRDVWSPSPSVIRYRAWKDALRPLCTSHGWSMNDSIEVRFVIQMPKSWSAKKKLSMIGMPHKQRPDIDNLCKAIMDFSGVDDGYVHTIIASKVWGDMGMIILRNA